MAAFLSLCGSPRRQVADSDAGSGGGASSWLRPVDRRRGLGWTFSLPCGCLSGTSWASAQAGDGAGVRQVGGAPWEESEGSKRLGGAGWGKAEPGKQTQKQRQSCVTVRVGLVLAVWYPLRWADEGWLPWSGKRLIFLEAVLSRTKSGSPLSWQLSSRL